MKPRPLLLLPFLLALSLGCTSLHAQQAIVLQQQMGTADFRQAGLDKLNPAELQHLQQWLAKHATELAAAVPASEAASANVAADKRPSRSNGWFGHTPDTAGKKANHTVISPLAGSFNGWRPGSILTLQNGQKWRVSDDSSLTATRPVDSPVATVKPGALGGWILKIEGYNTSARVEPAN
ncbi:hypothetical protein [Rhodanobacter soli]|uniref:Biotin carboxyl carrier protein n=1 Tax=Rhodanobacter soli TaxID=590609 RepID=A0ABV2Q080_9GAMM